MADKLQYPINHLGSFFTPIAPDRLVRLRQADFATFKLIDGQFVSGHLEKIADQHDAYRFLDRSDTIYAIEIAELVEHRPAGKKVAAALMFDYMGRPYRYAFDSQEWAEEFAEQHGLELEIVNEMSLDEAEKRGYEY